MNTPDAEYFRSIYLAMNDDDFATILRRAVQAPHELAEPALQAVRQIVAEQGIDVETRLRLANEHLAHDRAIGLGKGKAEARRSRQLSLFLGRILGFFGLAGGLVILGSSLAASHVGGSVAAVATIATSAWFLLRYKGD